MPMDCSTHKKSLIVIWGPAQNSLIHQTLSGQGTGEHTTQTCF